jgi:hypothetical protein
MPAATCPLPDGGHGAQASDGIFQILSPPACGTVQETIALLLGESVNPDLNDEHFQVVSSFWVHFV